MFVNWTRMFPLLFLLVGVGALAAGAPATSRPEPAATAAYDVLITDLRRAVSEIEGSTFSETK